MRKYALLPVFLMLLLPGCGKDQASQAAKAPAATPAAQPASMAETTGPIPSKLAHGVIDHTRDEKEFKLRRSLWGVESLIKDYKQKGYDTADLEKQRAELKQELDDLLT